MSNILIIKLGSLGDIAQISGALRDIREAYKDKKIFMLTTFPYVELLSKCRYFDGVLVDKRLPRWNFIYLLKLKKMLSKYNFNLVIDLQNSARTSFYRRFLLKNIEWSCTKTTLPKDKKKADFDKDSVLSRFDMQLKTSGIKTKHTLNPDFSWAVVNVDNIINQYFGKKFILLFPFCSPKLSHKKWPHYNHLIQIIKSHHKNFEIAIAPGPSELEDSKKINSIIIKNNNRSLTILELAGLINKSSYVIANDTGPAHMAAHLGKKGIVLFGYHTTAKKVSIETNKFKAISAKNLNLLTAEQVYNEIKDKLELIK
jgi:ADP-heptose:LPS heptosyltransferase